LFAFQLREHRMAIDGTTGDDTLIGASGVDVINGLEGNGVGHLISQFSESAAFG
jgi:hypothetical protein